MKTYGNRSNAIRAARAALGKTAVLGIDFEITGSDGAFGFAPLPTVLTPEGLQEVREHVTQADADPLDIPAALRISPEQRAEGWKRNPPKPAPALAPKAIKVKAKPEPTLNKSDALIAMLQKGATVDEMTKTLGWLPHTLRARICRLAKPRDAGGLGLRITRQREDGVTSYRAA